MRLHYGVFGRVSILRWGAMDIKKLALEKYYDWEGKIEVVSRTTVKSSEDPEKAYTPGVAKI